MTNEGLAIYIIAFASCILLVMIMAGDWKKPSDVCSKPPPVPKPEPRLYGPLYLRIQFCYHAGSRQRPDIYLRADDIRSVIADSHDSSLTIEKGMETLTFEDVEQYSFVKQSQMGDWLFEEDLDK